MRRHGKTQEHSKSFSNKSMEVQRRVAILTQAHLKKAVIW